MIIIDLIHNLALLVALSIVSSFIGGRWKGSRSGSVLQGILFGSIAIIGMLRPLNMGPGLIFDGRSVVVSLCGLFFGPLSVVIAGGMAMILRIYQGGIGTVMGILVISSSSLLGLLFYYKFTRRHIVLSALYLFGFGIVVHIAMLLMCAALPPDTALAVFKKIALPVMLTYPAATLLIGKIISDYLARDRFITELEASENVLRRSKLHIQALLHNIPDLIWLKNKDGVYLSCNKAFERFYGAAESDIIGKTDYDFADRELADFFRENDRKAIAAGKPTANEEWITFADDGHRALLDTIKTPMFDDKGKLIGVLGIGHDITRLKQTEEEIKALNEELLAAMEEMEATNKELNTRTDELQTKETTLLSALAERKLAEENVRKLLDEKELLLKEVHNRIKNNMNNIKGLITLHITSEDNPSVISSLRDLESRVQSMITLYDRLYFNENYRELPISDYLQSLIEEIVSSFPNRNIVKIETEIDQFILNVNILTPLGIIINELLTNIMKYAFAGMDSGLIKVSASINNGIACIEVQDNGSGIPESVISGNSRGFGLELVNLLTDQINGNMKIVRSEGTKFILEFAV